MCECKNIILIKDLLLFFLFMWKDRGDLQHISMAIQVWNKSSFIIINI